MDNFYNPKKEFYYFITISFVLNLILVSITAILITNLVNNSQKEISDQEKFSKLNTDLNLLKVNYSNLSKTQNLEYLRYRFNNKIQIADIVEQIENFAFQSGIKILDNEVVSAQENEIIINITIEGTLDDVRGFIEKTENRYTAKINNIRLRKPNQEFVLTFDIVFFKATKD